jgi:PAS domain S-box-containing protein
VAQGTRELRLGEAAAALLDALPEGVVVAGATGRVLYANARIEEVLAWAPSELLGQPVSVLVPERLKAAHERGFAAFAAGGPPRVAGRAVRLPALSAKGDEVQVELVVDRVSLGGQLLVVAAVRDATDRVELERHTEVVERVLAALADGPEELGYRIVGVVAESLGWDAGALWARETTGEVTFRDFWQRPGLDLAELAAATELATFALGEGLPGLALGGSPVWVEDVVPERAFPRRSGAVAASGVRSAFAFPLKAGRRTVGVIELFSTLERPVDEAMQEDLAKIGRRLGELLERAEVERERERLRQEQERLLLSQDFLLDAARELAEAVGYGDTLDRLATVAVPALADICVVDVLADDGSLERMAVRHADPAKQHLADELRQYPPDLGGRDPGAQVARTLRCQSAEQVNEAFLAAMSRDEGHFALLKRLGVSSYMCVPLVVQGHCFGALTLLSAGSGRRFGPADVSLAEQLARQAATVARRARHHDREREAAHLLQRSLLPERLLRVPGFEVAVRYLAGTEEADVGGDWYDVVPLSGGGAGFAIGDVEGHDVGAAAIMGQLRNALRAYALSGQRPAAVLDEMRRFFDMVEVERTATLLYATFSPVAGTLLVSSAGHPPPLLLRRAGGAEILRLDPEPPLGVAGPASAETIVALRPGDIVVLFTDGLVEQPGEPIDKGIEALLSTLGALQGSGQSDPETVCDLIVGKAIAPSARRDDMAFLVFKRAAG